MQAKAKRAQAALVFFVRGRIAVVLGPDVKIPPWLDGYANDCREL
jgi:hypothetical protein